MSRRFYFSDEERKAAKEENDLYISIVRHLKKVDCFTKMHCSKESDVEYISVDFNSTLTKDWPAPALPDAPTEGISFAQAIANDSYKKRREMVQAHISSVDKHAEETADKGEESFNLWLGLVLGKDAASCAEIMYALVRDGFAVEMRGCRIRVKMPPPCKQPIAVPKAPAAAPCIVVVVAENKTEKNK